MPLPNKAGEPEFKLKTDPADRVVIKYKKNDESTVTLTITNITKDRVCYKVKCTDNQIFRVRPPMGFIKPGETVPVKITLKSKEDLDPTRHFFAIYHITFSDLKEKDPRAAWKDGAKPDGVLRLQAHLETEDKADEKKDEKKEEKKDDDKKEDKKDDKKE
ncbi:unnamed protein product [Caenorhabditis brenneri]